MTSATILIVDDETLVARHLSLSLKAMGYTIHGIAHDGVGAVRLAAETRPDLLLMDIGLPGELSGLDAARQIQSFLESPVVFLTGYSELSILQQAKVLDPFGYVLKPFDERNLHITIEMALEKSRLERQLRESEQRYRELYISEQRKTRELALINRVQEEISRELNLSLALQAVVDAVADTFGYTLVSIYLRKGDTLYLQKQVGYDRTVQVIPINEGVIGRVAREGAPLLLDNVSDAPEFIAAADAIVSEIAVPLCDGDQVVGVLNVESERGERLTPDDLRLLSALSRSISLAVSRASLFTSVAESEERYRQFLQQFTGIAYQIDALTHEIFMFQGAVQEITGYTPDSFRAGQLVWIDILLPDDRPILEAAHARLRETDKATVDCEYRLRRADGETRWVRHVVRSVWHAAAGRKTLHGVIYDITDRKRAEQAENEERAFTEALLEIGSALNRSLKLDEVLDCILHNIRRVAPHDAASVMLIQDGVCRLDRHTGFAERGQEVYANTLRLSLQDTPNLRRMAESGEPFWIDDTLTNPYWLPIEDVLWIRSMVGAPIVVDGSVVGFLNLDSATPGIFNQRHAARLKAFASQAALALKNARMHEQAQRRAAEMSALNDTLIEITSQQELPSLLESITRRAAEMLGAAMGGLYLKTPGEDAVELVVSYHLPGATLGERLKYGEGLSGRVAQSGAALMIADHREWAGRADTFRDAPYRRVLGVPLKAGNEVLGVINVSDTEIAGEFDSQQISLLNMFADQAAVAVRNAQLLHTTRQQARNIALLNEITQAAIRTEGLPALLQTLADRLGELIGADGAYITLWDAEKETTIPAAAYGRMRETYPHVQSVAGEVTMTASVLKAGRVLAADNVLDTPYMSAHIAAEFPTRSLMGLPLIANQRKLGAALIGFDTPHHFTAEEIALGEQAAPQIALALAKARLFDEVGRLAVTDDLTGLYNYRGLRDMGRREMERFHRYHRPLSAILLDLDHFKQVNDTYGHPVGNQVLAVLAGRARQMMREIDILARYGGEEFVFLLPESEADSAFQAAERLRLAIGSLPMPTTRGELAVTVSVGVAEAGSDTPDLAALIQIADEAMYAAKNAGRNTTRVSYKHKRLPTGKLARPTRPMMEEQTP